MRKVLLGFGLFGILFFSACDSGGGSESNEALYSYVASTADGEVDLVRGSLRIRFGETRENGGTELSGTWNTHEVVDTSATGPQIGEGELSGWVSENDSMRINLNPNIADQNDILTGRFRRTRLALDGRWTYQTLGGSQSGEFSAFRSDLKD